MGWKRTAAIWAARDPGGGVIYLYSEHYQGMGEPASHAMAIRGRGAWISGHAWFYRTTVALSALGGS